MGVYFSIRIIGHRCVRLFCNQFSTFVYWSTALHNTNILQNPKTYIISLFGINISTNLYMLQNITLSFLIMKFSIENIRKNQIVIGKKQYQTLKITFFCSCSTWSLKSPLPVNLGPSRKRYDLLRYYTALKLFNEPCLNSLNCEPFYLIDRRSKTHSGILCTFY